MPRRSFCLTRRAAPLGKRHATASLAITFAIASFAIAGASPASATPQSELAGANAQAQRLEAQITANGDREEMYTEQFNEAQTLVAKANANIATAEKAITATEAHSVLLHKRLGNRAAELYMGAGNNDPIGIDATSVQDLGSRTKYSEAAAAQDARILDDLKLTDEQLHSQRSDLEHQRSDAQARQSQADAARHQVEAINAKTQTLLASTKANIRTLAAKIELERLAAEARAEQARLKAERDAALLRQRQNTNNGDTGGTITHNPGDIGTDPGPAPAPSPGAAAAIAYARAQIGKPYRYAGAGPGSFDCSGLTMMSWAAGGVGMDHVAADQWASFPHVAISALAPGDLVFFGSPIHHVGIYVGGGTMIEAPHTGAFVRYATIYRRDLVSTGARP